MHTKIYNFYNKDSFSDKKHSECVHKIDRKFEYRNALFYN